MRVEAADVRASVTIVELLDRPKKTGAKQWRARCPIHGGDSLQSLGVFTHRDGTQLFSCFACGAKGNVIDFVIARDGLGFRAALEMLSGGRTFEQPTGATRDALTRAADAHEGAWLLVCDACGARRQLEAGIDAWLALDGATSWWVGRHRAYCAGCVAERLGRRSL